MISNIIYSYILIFGGIVIWGILLPKGKKLPQILLDSITAFGGAFLLGSCFINLVPHMYAHGFAIDGIKIGVAVLIGFLIQLLLESLTNGIEHGHNHCHCCEEESDTHHHDSDSTSHEAHHHHHHDGLCHENHTHPVTGLMIGLSIHAFLEGMPLVDTDGTIHQSLLYGIILHNIPLALVLLTLFVNNRFSLAKSLLLLSVFAIMTPLGSLCNLFIVSNDNTVQAFIMGIVVGILLHVSVSILFDHESKHKYLKIILIILAFIAAYFTPGCPEIYG
ncbi:MAG: ZIP family metal transporter [Bacteroidales bacterium]|nr:ZIP family metal transporter [Bacteroidales bacterium]